MTEPDGLHELRQQFPSWHFGVVWTAACSGPDRRRVVACKGPVILSAWNPDALARDIKREEANS